MNWDQIQGNWKQFKARVKQQWGKLTDDDIAQIQGKREELVGRIQEQYGFAKEQAEKELNAFASGADKKRAGTSLHGSCRQLFSSAPVTSGCPPSPFRQCPT